MSRFLGAMGLGFSTSLSCVLTCLPVYLPFSVSAEGRRDWANVGMLLGGRLAAYLLMGALAGIAGSAFSTTTIYRLSSIAIIPLAVLLFLRASGLFSREIPFCGLLLRASERIRSPLIVGFLLGFSICYPFLIVIVVAAAAGNAAGGMTVFAGFFLGTSAFLVPLFLLPLVRQGAFRQWLNAFSSAAAAALAIFYLVKALQVLVPPANLQPAITQADVEKLFPTATGIEYVSSVTPKHYLAYSGSAEGRVLEGYAVGSSECAPDIRGYAGPVPLLVALDGRGRVLRVVALPNEETPSYVSRLFSDRYLARFAGKSHQDPLRIGTDIDAVTGATVSLDALTRTLRETLRVFATSILHEEPTSEPQAQAARPALDLGIVAFLAAAGLSLVVLSFGLRLRRWFLLLTIVLLGLGFHFFLSIADLVKVLFAVPYSPAEIVPRLILGGAALALTLALGRHYCSVLCPYGAAQELLYAVSPLKRVLSPGLDAALRPAKFAILIAVPFFYAFARNFSVLSFEPFAATFHAATSLAFLRDLIATQFAFFLFLLVLLLVNLVTERFYCKYLCPLGALFALLSAARIFPRQRFMIPGRTCAGCAKGLASLPSECFACGGHSYGGLTA